MENPIRRHLREVLRAEQVDDVPDRLLVAPGGKVLIAFFSWGGNTKGIAEEIQSQTGADLPDEIAAWLGQNGIVPQ